MCCNKCVDADPDCDCESGHFSYTQHEDPFQAFVEFSLYSSKLDKAIVMAHNGGRYDHNFVLSMIMSKYKIIPEYVSNGTSLITANIKKRQNYGKILNGLPSKRFYDPDNMEPLALFEFEKWYEDHKTDLFNADQELLTYCQSDVNILTAAVGEYI
ncbi:unnamed protein product [Caenorhabditis brenneri]